MTLTYHNDLDIKTGLLAQITAHRAADQIVKGQYWEDGKGCAIGCMVYSSSHQAVVDEFGWTLAVARLVDAIFEGLPNDKALDWPLRIATAHKPGSDTSLVHWQFLHWLLTDEAVTPGINHPLVRDAVKKCALVVGARASGKPIDKSAAWSAAWAADSAAKSGESAARSAAWSAADSARSAADSAARSAESAAWSAKSAAKSAESAAMSYVLMADKLVELVEAAPMGAK